MKKGKKVKRVEKSFSFQSNDGILLGVIRKTLVDTISLWCLFGWIVQRQISWQGDRTQHSFQFICEELHFQYKIELKWGWRLKCHDIWFFYPPLLILFFMPTRWLQFILLHYYIGLFCRKCQKSVQVIKQKSGLSVIYSYIICIANIFILYLIHLHVRVI